MTMRLPGFTAELTLLAPSQRYAVARPRRARSGGVLLADDLAPVQSGLCTDVCTKCVRGDNSACDVCAAYC
jgi:hypothetical protein